MKQSKNESGNQEIIGTATGAGLGAAAGMGGTVAAISSLGVSGLSGPGIVSGLAALGGGSMLSGLVVATGGTALLVGGLGYGGYRIAKWLKNKST